MTIHLRPTAPIAPDALLPGDPGRAMALAQELLVAPRMSNHHRGLWGYYGETERGDPLTIQATGIGGPSAAIVLAELAELGVMRAIRVGTCSAHSAELAIGSLVVADAAVAADGTSRELGAGDVVRAAPGLTDALAAAAPAAHRTQVVTVDLFYLDRARLDAGIAAFEMEAAPLFALGPMLGVDVACVLAVAAGRNGRPRISDAELAGAELEMGRAAARALGGTRPG